MSFLEFYNSILRTSFISYEALPYPVQKVRFEKGMVITDYGQIEKSIYFLNSGIVEMAIKSYMSEKIIDFFYENDMFTSLTSFLTQQPSDVQMIALMDCEAEIISHEDLMYAYNDSFEANKLGRIVLEQAYLNKAQREKDFLTLTAEERYTEMFRTRAKYISNIPVNKIAKYLGIHPESLSRIRSKMNS